MMLIGLTSEPDDGGEAPGAAGGGPLGVRANVLVFLAELPAKRQAAARERGPWNLMLVSIHFAPERQQ